MAILKNAPGDTYIIINLKETEESPDWIGYNMTVYVQKKEQPTEILTYSNPERLCLENLFEKEVPSLLDALQSILNGKVSSYVFEPCDERDFRLEIRHEISVYGDFYITNFFMRYPIILGEYQWDFRSSVGVQLKVTKNSLLEFYTELKQEYENLGKLQLPAKT
jgi:hypothetical protein